jgi:hypothetical protein
MPLNVDQISFPDGTILEREDRAPIKDKKLTVWTAKQIKEYSESK